jgi:hypothetical protein
VSDETLTECLMFVSVAIVTVGVFSSIICGTVDP